jgi:hypothetical protein
MILNTAMMLDKYDRSIRNIQDRVFEQSLDFVYFTKIESKLAKDYLQNLLKIEVLFQKSVANFYIYSKN